MGWLSPCQSIEEIIWKSTEDTQPIRQGRDEGSGQMNPTGRFLVIEPRGHVSEKDFEITVSIAEQNGFEIIERLRIGRGHALLLGKRKC